LSKKKRPKKNNVQPKSQRSLWLWGAAAIALLFVVGGISLLLISGQTEPENGTPKVVVNQTTIDEGYQKRDKTIRTSFTLRNDGDATLRILGEPKVELVEGC
jgi:hypothetical protein